MIYLFTSVYMETRLLVIKTQLHIYNKLLRTLVKAKITSIVV